MNRDFFLNAGLQFEPSSHSPWKLMPEIGLLPEQSTADAISRRNWENSDRFSQFDSALTSMASSPVSDIVLNSLPPNLNSPIMDHFVKENLPTIQNSVTMNPDLPLLAADPGFAERAAKFSCFGNGSFNGRNHQLGVKLNSPETQFVSNHQFPHLGFEENRNSDEINVKLSRLSASAANSNEESSVSEQRIPSGEHEFKNKKDLTRKRKVLSSKKGEEAIDESRKLKKTEEENGGKMDENTKALEPVKDYIHVRARRGQATDSHSLAERVRREKISERMKLLQNLVPTCNKVTGKALMLDEIINYVQSLQKQVEFLSMKLATVNPSADIATNDIISHNINQPNGNSSQHTSHFYQQDHQELFNESLREFTQPFSHFQGFHQDDLQSVVRMGFNDNFDLDTSFNQLSNMKTEL